MTIKKLLYIFTSVILLPALCLAQKPSDAELFKKKYPGEKAIILNDQEDVLIEVDGNAYKITETVLKETYLLQNVGTVYASDKVYSSHFAKLKEIDAKTLVPDGNKFTTKKVEKFVETQDQSDNVFYDEVVSKSFVFPAVQPGAITSLKFVRELSNPLAMNSFFFKWHIPCETSKITIKADKRAKLRFKLFNVEPSSLEFTQQEKGKFNIYTWTAKNIRSAYYEQDAPDIRYYYPHIAYYIENLNPTDTINKAFKGLNGLYHYYHGLLKDLNTEEDPKLRAEVDKIVAGAASEQEKVKRIFYWVQDNINYIAFEEGMQGLIPEQASKVYNKRYGDCKGMSSLMNNMLKLAGVKSYITWIGTRHLPYKYTDVPSEIVDNHMIVTYYDNGKPVFLDGTNNYLPFGTPSSMIQGKQALVGIDDDNYKIEEVPIIKSDRNAVVDSFTYTIRNNSVEGYGRLSLTGYEKNIKTYSLTGKDAVKTKDRVLGIVTKGNNKFFLDSFSVDNLNNREVPVVINYKFRVDDYFKNIDGEVYLNLNLTKPFANNTYDPEKRPIPVENGNLRLFRYVSVFIIPDNYQVSLLPKDRAGTFDKFSFTIHYKVEGNKVTQVKEIREEYMLLEPSEFKKWNETIESLDQAYRDMLVIKKITKN